MAVNFGKLPKLLRRYGVDYFEEEPQRQSVESNERIRSARNALSNNAIDRRWRDIRVRSYFTDGHVIGSRHSFRCGSTFCFVWEIKKSRRRTDSASRRATNDECHQN